VLPDDREDRGWNLVESTGDVGEGFARLPASPEFSSLPLREAVVASTWSWHHQTSTRNRFGQCCIDPLSPGWLFFDVLGREFPDEVKADLPIEVRADDGLTRVGGLSLEDHLGRLDRTRAVFLEQVRDMDLGDFRRLSAPEGEDYECTPEWVIYHLIEHEAGHAYQMRSLRRRARAAFGGAGG
jgi:hypothetical protein